jgi:hypothetical protein
MARANGWPTATSCALQLRAITQNGNQHRGRFRYARLVYAVGALYDFRSNRDVTGQEQAVRSRAPAQHAARRCER